MTAQESSMAVVMPLWTATLSASEMALLRITDQSTRDVDCWWVIPEGLDVSKLRDFFPRWQARVFPAEHFRDVRAYSYWMTSPELYRAFDDYDFITLCQTDAVLVKSPSGISLDSCDYVGSVWEPPLRALIVRDRVYVSSDAGAGRGGFWGARFFGRRYSVGNGGLSVRRIRAFLKTTEQLANRQYENARIHVQEDALLVTLGARLGLAIASESFASSVFMERALIDCTEMPDVFGFHALERWNPVLFRGLVCAC